eukprot:Awhi_evm1s15826
MAPTENSQQHHNIYINLFVNKKFDPNPYINDNDKDVQKKQPWNQWGRCVIYVEDVDAMYNLAMDKGLSDSIM